MNRTLVGAIIWFLTSAAVWAAMSFPSIDVTDLFFYPRDGKTLWIASFFWIAIPCSCALGLALVAGEKPRPDAATCLWTVMTALILLTVTFATALFLMNTADSSALRRIFPASDIVFGTLAMLLFSLSSVWLPLVSPKDTSSVSFRPKWRAFFIVLCLAVFFMGLSIFASKPIPSVIADFAKDLGLHYYTWLNIAGPALITTTVLAGATTAGIQLAGRYHQN